MIINFQDYAKNIFEVEEYEDECELEDYEELECAYEDNVTTMPALAQFLCGVVGGVSLMTFISAFILLF